uniref:Uncharacterized protein n=1 Tax=Oryza sativa subsp. japonica TaxID=39947 RepID=Q6H7S1_ORYSJ|nr:hypothetical protein [Oryza sativa Japonica Group]
MHFKELHAPLQPFTGQLSLREGERGEVNVEFRDEFLPRCDPLLAVAAALQWQSQTQARRERGGLVVEAGGLGAGRASP